MRVLLDTNVLIAALITRGVCNDLLEHCFRQHIVVSSQFILDELHEHLTDKFKYTLAEADEAEELLRSKMEMVIPSPLEQPVCRDKDDDRVLGTGVAGNVECLVTGDKDLLTLKRYKSFDILKPSDFSEYEAKHDKTQEDDGS